MKAPQTPRPKQNHSSVTLSNSIKSTLLLPPWSRRRPSSSTSPTTSPHLRCHIYSKEVWQSLVSMLGSPGGVGHPAWETFLTQIPTMFLTWNGHLPTAYNLVPQKIVFSWPGSILHLVKKYNSDWTILDTMADPLPTHWSNQAIPWSTPDSIVL